MKVTIGWIERRNDTWDDTVFGYKVIKTSRNSWRVRLGKRVVFAGQKTFENAVAKAENHLLERIEKVVK